MTRKRRFSDRKIREIWLEEPFCRNIFIAKTRGNIVELKEGQS